MPGRQPKPTVNEPYSSCAIYLIYSTLKYKIIIQTFQAHYHTGIHALTLANKPIAAPYTTKKIKFLHGLLRQQPSGNQSGILDVFPACNSVFRHLQGGW